MKTVEEIIADIEKQLDIAKDELASFPYRDDSPLAGQCIGAIDSYTDLLRFIRGEE